VTIIDAIRHAAGEDAVYSLLTSYLESLWEGDQSNALCESLRRLPIDSKADVLRRAQVLESLDAHESPVIAEAREIFCAASEWLQSAATHNGYMRNDWPSGTVLHKDCQAMTDCAYKPGDRVRTPAHTEGVVVTVHRGPRRGRRWREPVYYVELADVCHAKVYAESELRRVEDI
jgi:hypothetical protein